MKSILVHMTDHSWTAKAVHLACALARSQQAEVVLLRMIPVTHPSYLGTPHGYTRATVDEQEDIKEYAATAKNYQVKFSVQPMEFITAMDAIVEAAELVEAAAVFASIPESGIPYWQKFRTWRLENRLAAQNRKLFTLADGVTGEDQVTFIMSMPSGSIPAHSRAAR